MIQQETSPVMRMKNRFLHQNYVARGRREAVTSACVIQKGQHYEQVRSGRSVIEAQCYLDGPSRADIVPKAPTI